MFNPGVIITTSFAQLGLPEDLVRALASRNIVEPFPVQSVTIPDALAGKDIAGMAPTGSGKTLAFGLPLLAEVGRGSRYRPRALVLAPTRELAEQIKQELAPLAGSMRRSIAAIYGGVGYGPQLNALRRGVDVLVATPGRLEDLISQGSIDLRDVGIAVVDEADRMADMGFLPAVRRILDDTPSDRQTMLFSATLDGDIAVLSRDYQVNPVRHEAGVVDHDSLDADHHFWLVEAQDRVKHTADLVEAGGRSIVFTRTRRGADRVAKQLGHMGVSASALHGGRSQSQRASALRAFSTGRTKALIATDVAARGIHIEKVASVIHFDIPGDHKDYVHRSGRTARAGETGTVVTLVTHDQRRTVRQMQKRLALQEPIVAPDMSGMFSGDQRVVSGDQRVMGAPTPVSRPAGPAIGGIDEQSLYVGNMPWNATAADMESLFGRYGTVLASTIITDRRSGRSKGFGFVDMDMPEAKTAIESLNGSTYGGRSLTVRIARPRRG